MSNILPAENRDNGYGPKHYGAFRCSDGTYKEFFAGPNVTIGWVSCDCNGCKHNGNASVTQTPTEPSAPSSPLHNKSLSTEPSAPPLPSPENIKMIKQLKGWKSKKTENEKEACTICLDNEKNVVFQCGHRCCSKCATDICKKTSMCHICQKDIEQVLQTYD